MNTQLRQAFLQATPEDYTKLPSIMQRGLLEHLLSHYPDWIPATKVAEMDSRQFRATRVALQRLRHNGWIESKDIGSNEVQVRNLVYRINPELMEIAA